MRKLYRAVKEVLVNLRHEATGQAVFQTVDLDKGQMDRLLGQENREGIIFFPAVFVRFTDIHYDAYTEGVRRGYCNMIFRIVLTSPLGVSDDEIFDYRDLLDAAVMDARYEEEDMAILDIHYEDMPTSYDDTIEWNVTYRATFLDERSYRYRHHRELAGAEVAPLLEPRVGALKFS